MNSADDKKIIIIVGPDDARKTTFAREFLPNEAVCTVFINAGLIAAGLAPFESEAATFKDRLNNNCRLPFAISISESLNYPVPNQKLTPVVRAILRRSG